MLLIFYKRNFILTYKSDHLIAHQEILNATIWGKRVPNREDPPESFRVLVQELRSLALELNHFLVSEKNFQINGGGGGMFDRKKHSFFSYLYFMIDQYKHKQLQIGLVSPQQIKAWAKSYLVGKSLAKSQDPPLFIIKPINQKKMDCFAKESLGP
jgi:hypothetical protein